MVTFENKKKAIVFVNIGLFIFVVFILALKLNLVFIQDFAHDEFHYLSMIHDFQRESLKLPLQNFHVHFFQWLTQASEIETTQLLFARSIMISLLLGSCVLTYIIGRKFLGKSGALFSVLCYTSFAYVFVNGSSFRYDPICSFLFLLTVFLLVKKKSSNLQLIIAGLIMSISLMISMKAIFHLATICCILLILFFYNSDKKKAFKKVSYFIFVLLVGYIGLYKLHETYFPHSKFSTAKQYVSSSYTKQIIFDDIFPRGKYILASIYLSPLFWPLLFAGVALTLWKLIISQPELRKNNLILISFIIPILTLIFYRNTAPYYYVFILTPAVIFTGITADEWVKDYKKKGSYLYLIPIVCISCILLGYSVKYYSIISLHNNKAQKDVVRVVHQIFPKPVPYIDGCKMIASFPQVGFFMSSWNMESYLKANKPRFKRILKTKKPKFLISNIPPLDLLLQRENAVSIRGYGLLKEDWEVLNDNFIHYWGPLFILGKKFILNSISDVHYFEILVGGVYTIESNNSVLIDGKVCSPGSITNLDSGYHFIAPLEMFTIVKIRWGRNIGKVEYDPPKTPIFHGRFG